MVKMKFLVLMCTRLKELPIENLKLDIWSMNGFFELPIVSIFMFCLHEWTIYRFCSWIESLQNWKIISILILIIFIIIVLNTLCIFKQRVTLYYTRISICFTLALLYYFPFFFFLNTLIWFDLIRFISRFIFIISLMRRKRVSHDLIVLNSYIFFFTYLKLGRPNIL